VGHQVHDPRTNLYSTGTSVFLVIRLVGAHGYRRTIGSLYHTAGSVHVLATAPAYCSSGRLAVPLRYLRIWGIGRPLSLTGGS